MSSLLSSDLEAAVRERYAQGARQSEAALCCPVSYDPRYLTAIPIEVIERDYGCGDPSRWLQEGETVLDLGSGTGKVCFIASQIVGPRGRVIGVDMNDEMLAVARRNAPIVAQNVGFTNTEFRKGRIQDLALDLAELEQWLGAHPVKTAEGWSELESYAAQLRRVSPMIGNESIDVVVSNCVLNLVRPQDKVQMFEELHRVLRRGGRAIISDIASSAPVPMALQENAELWSGCVSGALTETGFLEAFEQAGFYGATILQRDPQAWRTVEGIQFRSITVAAYKGKEGPCVDAGQTVIYKGPFREVTDDDGHVLRRGVRTAVCEKTFAIYGRAPYEGQFELLEENGSAVSSGVAPLSCAPGSKCC